MQICLPLYVVLGVEGLSYGLNTHGVKFAKIAPMSKTPIVRKCPGKNRTYQVKGYKRQNSNTNAFEGLQHTLQPFLQISCTESVKIALGVWVSDLEMRNYVLAERYAVCNHGRDNLLAFREW